MLKMMTSSDTSPDAYSDWYIFNTWLQNQTSSSIHIDIPLSYSELHQRLDEDSVDIVYANPYDASTLVRDKGFVPIARPKGINDEIVIVVNEASSIPNLENIPEFTRIALTDDRDIKLLGMILIEPSDLSSENVHFDVVESSVIVAKRVMNGESALGFIPARSFDAFSNVIHKSLRVLVKSEIDVIHHCLMVKPEVLDKLPQLPLLLHSMHNELGSKQIVENLGLTEWLPISSEKVEFMIDLMETMK